MADDTTARRSRRALIVAGLGGLLSVLAFPRRQATVNAASASHEPVVLGADNAASAPTRIASMTAPTAFVADAAGPGVGMLGTTETGIGVYGLADRGFGLLGSSVSGSGIEAVSPDGIALRVRRGRIRADGISGIATIATGTTSTSIAPAVRMPSDAFVLLSPMMDLGERRSWATTDPENNVITVHVSEPSDRALVMGWLLLG